MRRKILKSPICLICGEDEESVEHMLLVCDWTTGIWFKCCFGLKICKEKITPPFDRWLLEKYRELRKSGREDVMTRNMVPLSLCGSTLRSPHGCQAQYMENMGSIASLVM